MNNDSTLGKENASRQVHKFLDKHSINLKEKSIVHLSILIVMHDHIILKSCTRRTEEEKKENDFCS